MTDEEKEDWANELHDIASKIDRLANKLTDDEYSQATVQIKKDLEECKRRLDHVVKNL